MMIEINNRTYHKINLNLVKRLVNKFARAYKVEQKEISIAFIGDAEIKKLNRAYRQKDEPTDILSFAPLNNAESDVTGQAGEDNFLGELVIDYSQIKRQAGQFDHSARQEMIFILVHGLLHLVGYDDKTERGRKQMIKLGEKFIKKLKI
ncbi:rRNA maturation RNase YbeY [Candidatus Falkowbacteria bacterium RIFCSPLOWO2_12_FULL_45_13]|uniref:Endoribonuclease YbeY n=2 Tax=Candidatus Falkowiibacteriota TaxID=1752728 RepID=A0A1F5SCH2_9BACT|nr:MAG: rRNA maturation RNase YbeY [Candidatus Falkowbacteria bacterium RIFCSPLOWO2_02_FULL_45_21]OGF32031.1 MAG: rRNA maturation RNase YbeY [Candidatus Falkowbacteria bacterium RIFCSPLOWO2_12_FULL_45_13]